MGLSCQSPVKAGGAVPQPCSHTMPGIRGKSKVFPLPDPSSLPAGVGEKGRQKLGEIQGAYNFFSPPTFLRFPRTLEGSDPSQGEEANRWHCAVSGGAQPFWRPGMACLNAGKALRSREVSAPAEAQSLTGERAPWPFICPWPKSLCKASVFVHSPGMLSVNRKKEAKPSSKLGQC